MVGAPGYGTYEASIDVIRSWEPLDSINKDYVTGGTVFNAFLEVVFMGQTRERWPAHSYATLASVREKYLNADFKSTTLNNFSYSADYGVSDASLISSMEGYIGVAHHVARKGELPCLAFALRR